MRTIKKIAKTIDIGPVKLKRKSLGSFLEKELKDIEVENSQNRQ